MESSPQNVELVFSTDELNLLVSESASALELLEIPDGYEAADISWKSTDKKVASVNKNGMVKAVAAGTCTVIASIGEADCESSLTVIVEKAENERIQEIIDLIKKLPEPDEENLEDILESAEKIIALYEEILEMDDADIEKISNYEKLEQLVEMITAQISPMGIVASGACGDNVSYTLDSTGVLTISGYGPMKNYWSSLWEDMKVTSVIITDGVTSVGNDAFRNCDQITHITLPGSVKEIGSDAFRGCVRLNSITLPANLYSLGSYAFGGCTALTQITIPGSVKAIENSTFRGCTRLSSVIIKSGVTEIKQGAFYDCSALTTISIPGSITSIGYEAFRGCSRLSSVTLTAGNLVSIGDYAFYSCEKLTSISIPGNVDKIGSNAFANTGLKTLTLGQGITEIGNYAFNNCIGLTNLRIPGSVSTIGNGAFASCTSLKTVTLAEGISSIGSYAFKSCISLGTISIPGTVNTVGYEAFRDCTSLSTATMKPGVVTIKGSAFYNCTGLKQVTIPEGVTAIDDHAFYRCTALSGVVIPSSVAVIGSYAFSYAGITSLQIRSGVTEIGPRAFAECKFLTSVTVPGSVTTIGNSAFTDCTGIRNLVLSNGIVNINYGAFMGCTSLADVSIPGSVLEIGGDAFRKCSGLVNVTIGEGVSTIDNYAFAYCGSLSSVSIPESVLSIGARSFYEDSLVKIYGESGSYAERYSQSNGIRFVDLSSIKLTTPVISKVINIVQGTHVYWNTVRNAETYTIYRSLTQNGSYTRLATVSATHYIDTSAKSGTTYFYKIRANVASFQSPASAARGVAFVGTPDLTLRVNRSTGIGLGGDKITGATGYAIYRKTTGDWVRVATIPGNSTFTWTDAAVKSNNGTTYKYTVRALAGADMKTLSGCRTTGRTMVRLFTPTLSEAKKTAATSIQAAWNRNTAATGYEVRFMVGSNVYQTYVYGNNTIIRKTITSLDRGNTYKIQVRSYKKVAGVGTFYSAWSGDKKVYLP